MNDLSARVRASLWWLLPLALLALLIGWEIDWGTAVRVRPPPATPVVPQPVTMGLLPDYVIAGGIASHTETVDRTLFNPTRRPAPVAVVEAAKPRIERGQYALTGTTVAGDRSLAFLKETSGGKARTVKTGRDDQRHAGRRSAARPGEADAGRRIGRDIAQGRDQPAPDTAAGCPGGTGGAATPGAAAISPGAQPQPWPRRRKRRRRWPSAGGRRARPRPRRQSQAARRATPAAPPAAPVPPAPRATGGAGRRPGANARSGLGAGLPALPAASCAMRWRPADSDAAPPRHQPPSPGEARHARPRGAWPILRTWTTTMRLNRLLLAALFCLLPLLLAGCATPKTGDGSTPGARGAQKGDVAPSRRRPPSAQTRRRAPPPTRPTRGSTGAPALS